MATPHSTPIPDGYKRCCYGDNCVHLNGPVLPATNEYYSKHPRSADRLQRQCKACDSDRKRKAYQAVESKEHKQLYNRTHRQKPEVRERIREKKREYNNLPQSKQWMREYQKRYKKTENGRQKSIISLQRYRTSKRSLPNSFTISDWQRALSYFNGCCAVCGRQLNDLFGEHTASMDHWIPLSNPECPGTVATNIVPLCHGVGGCNNSKQKTLPFEWLMGRYGKRKANEINQRIQAYFTWVGSAAS